MKRRQLALIDHSIVDASGHYLEYARRVLGAAKSEGFRTILAINQCAKNLECAEADLILKPFSKTFWENQAQSRFRTVIGFLLNKKTFAIQQGRASMFADQLAFFLRQANIKKSDLVFIPTLGGIELMGISLYSASVASVSVHWHLLFRRDLPLPSTWFDIQSYAVRWKVKNSFTMAESTFLKGIRYFYTDTEELTNQYENLGVGKFKTLPIPIDCRLGFKQSWRQGTLVVSYIGDFRAEKGIHLLPQIIEFVRQVGFDSSKVVFRIQCNQPNGATTRSSTRIKKALSSRKLDGVELIDEPLSSTAYHNLLLESDIIILPYSVIDYTARSSGIFAEAISAGIPTIHPQDSWMGRNAASLSISGYIGTDQIGVRLKALLQDYKQYEKVSNEVRKKWRAKHSAKRLIQILRDNQINFLSSSKNNSQI